MMKGNWNLLFLANKKIRKINWLFFIGGKYFFIACKSTQIIGYNENIDCNAQIYYTTTINSPCKMFLAIYA